MNNKNAIDNASRFPENHICNNDEYASQMSNNSVKELRIERKPMRRC